MATVLSIVPFNPEVGESRGIYRSVQESNRHPEECPNYNQYRIVLLIKVLAKRSIDYPAQGNPYKALPPFARRGGGTVCGRTLTYSTRFDSIPGEPGRCTCSGTHHTRNRFRKETFDVRFEPRVLATPNVKVLPLSYMSKNRVQESNRHPEECPNHYRIVVLVKVLAKRAIDYPAQGNPYNSWALTGWLGQ